MIKKTFWENLLVVFIVLFYGLNFYFYRPQIMVFWNSLFQNKSGEFFGLLNNSKEDTKEIAQIKDCGETSAPDLNNSTTYKDNSVLACLGRSALFCENAKAVIKDPLFPTIFEIVKNKNMCNFKLSYPDTSTLVDVTGKKLAGQYVSCPTYIVKVIDKNGNILPSVFGSTTYHDINDPNNLSKSASQIYNYGTLGLFMENNLNQNKIESLGCNGSYIDTVMASYKKMQISSK